MIVRSVIRKDSYFDSLVLMRVSTKMREMEGVEDAAVMMGTEANKQSLLRIGLLTDEIKASGPNDVCFVVGAKTQQSAEQAIALGERLLLSRYAVRDKKEGLTTVKTLGAALAALPGANLALLSILGIFVRREATRALENGLNVFIFSDNVPLEDEMVLKRMAQEKGLLVMGPDCGTAIIGGTALAFANKVRRGAIGVVGASGTGMQEVTCLIHRLGEGVSHAIGAGSRDVSEAVNGATMLQGLALLESDTATRVIVLVSKPPAPGVVKTILEAVGRCSKPVIINFLGSEEADISRQGAIFTDTLEDTAVRAVVLLHGSGAREERLVRKSLHAEVAGWAGLIKDEYVRLTAGQTWVRGVFSGGTFANEAALILSKLLGEVYTNTNLRQAVKLKDAHFSIGHTCVDLGEDEFTLGKPHPMLEPAIRRDRILAEAVDPGTAIILLDVVLGYGVHPDPASVLAPIIVEAKERAQAGRRHLPVIVSVCGTEEDPQCRSMQVAKLREVGAVIAPSNAAATRMAAAIACRGQLPFSEAGLRED
ncbi:MAG: acyl-CoA synthetase FdrA [Chloroflexi bacterium]|nr:acyl-CoA synthetase FdrA [Chloroflexota bacterium]MCL5074067.1 acyl-CoA synthetase FdrA [Chloroflexota bacterium]